ncbi:glycosyltransferase family protein [Pontibacter fetidus]|uniref:Surface carbohydrate biosynthesis protein n=1 Tax=Pontibacter fetidus TaxID=2700082 RepID=A0A6B2H4G3_9BACT|nr:hypothetical protein [Pontibacter fetidus]NDK55516.1 hypothetical protein [Pontibacter fetidus]
MMKWFTLYSNILHLHFSEGFYQLPESAKNAVSPTRPFTRFLKVMGYSLVRLVGNLFKDVENGEKLQGKVWLYVVSQNNVDSLAFLNAGLPNAVLVAGQSKELGKYHKTVQRISLRRKLLYYYKFLPLIFTFLKYKKDSTLRFYDLLYDAIGFYEVYLQKLRKYKPTAIVFANDHNADARAMLLAAKTIGIKTAYIQHASITPIFPALQFDLNLLEGQDSLDKYKLCGPVQGRVKLVGMPKADAYMPFRNTNTEIKTIGIGCNLMDNLTEIGKLLHQLTTNFPTLKFILRPHPRDTRNFKTIAAISPVITISDGKKEATFDYLQQLDVQISGNSGIHLEAVLLNVWSIFYNMNTEENLQDYYGYIKHGLVDACMDYAGLQQLLKQHLQQKPVVYLRASYYNATIGTTSDGKSSELALKYISEFIGSNQQVNA